MQMYTKLILAAVLCCAVTGCKKKKHDRNDPQAAAQEREREKTKEEKAREEKAKEEKYREEKAREEKAKQAKAEEEKAKAEKEKAEREAREKAQEIAPAPGGTPPPPPPPNTSPNNPPSNPPPTPPSPNPNAGNTPPPTTPTTPPVPPANPSNNQTMNTPAPEVQTPKEKAPAGMQPSVPAPTTSPTDTATLTRVIEPQNETTYYLAKYLGEIYPDRIENTRDKLVGEVFNDEDEARGKILEIQGAVGKLAAQGLYNTELQNRVGFLQSRMLDHMQKAEFYDILEKGVLVAGTGVTLGLLASTGAYRHLPEAAQSLRTGLSETQASVREKMSAVYNSGREKANHLRETVSDRQKLNEAVDHTRATLREAKDRVVQASSRARRNFAEGVRQPFRSVDSLVRDNLDDLGLTRVEQNFITQLRPAQANEVASSVQFTSTPKATFRFAVLDELEGRPLGIERAFVFRQQRIVRGSPLETDLVTNSMPAEVAGTIASRLTLKEGETPSRQFVHFLNLRTGAVQALRWPVDKFNQMLAAADQKVKPMFLNLDFPTFAGTTLATAGVSGVLYWAGYNNGSNRAQQYDAVNLEAFVPKTAVKPAPPANTEPAQSSLIGRE